MTTRNQDERKTSDKTNETPVVVDDVEVADNNQASDSRRYPEPFYDPATGKVMQDPVVDAQGDSHEKTADHGDNDYYLNRALRDIIAEQVPALQEEDSTTSSSWRESYRRMDHTIQEQWNRLVDQSAFRTLASSEPYRPLPAAYYCPILSEIMTDPVITKEGMTYERAAIQHWIQANHTSPLTRNPLTTADIRPNNAIYDLIQLEKVGHSTMSTHPSIRRWRESGVASTRPDLEATPNNHSDTQPPPPPFSPPAPPTIPTTGRLPTTQADIEQRRASAGGRVVLCVFILATFAVLLLFVPFGFWIFLGLIFWCTPGNGSRQQRRRQ